MLAWRCVGVAREDGQRIGVSNDKAWMALPDLEDRVDGVEPKSGTNHQNPVALSAEALVWPRLPRATAHEGFPSWLGCEQCDESCSSSEGTMGGESRSTAASDDADMASVPLRVLFSDTGTPAGDVDLLEQVCVWSRKTESGLMSQVKADVHKGNLAGEDTSW